MITLTAYEMLAGVVIFAGFLLFCWWMLAQKHRNERGRLANQYERQLARQLREHQDVIIARKGAATYIRLCNQGSRPLCV